jgi:hypothetical protein
MPSLDTCISDLYEPGNIPGDSGQPPASPINISSSFITFLGAGSLSSDATRIVGTNNPAIFAGAGSLSIVAFSTNNQATFHGTGSFSASASVASPPAEFEILTVSAADSTTFTFAAQPIGTASATRRVIVGTVQGLTSAVTASSVTIGGISASLLKRQVVGNGNAEFWMATVSSGTTADVVVTWSSLVGRCGVAIWSVPNLNSDTPIDTDGGTIEDAANASDLTVTTEISANVLGIGMTVDGGGMTWRNMTERDEQTLEIQANTHRLSAADAIASGSSLTVGVDGNGTDIQNGNSPFAVVVLR